MGLNDLLDEVDDTDLPGHCPKCGKKGRDNVGNEFKCTTPRDECGVLWWREPDYEVEIEA